jgi:transcriptional regulator with XRE-family HTH domain
MSTAVANYLTDIIEHGGLKGVDIAFFANVSKPTVSRWLNGKSSPSIAMQLHFSDLQYIIERLSALYEPEEIRIWLWANHRGLDDQRAIDLIFNNKMAEVLKIIESFEAGAYL